jgi:hypothetical protein
MVSFGIHTGRDHNVRGEVLISVAGGPADVLRGDSLPFPKGLGDRSFPLRKCWDHHFRHGHHTCAMCLPFGQHYDTLLGHPHEIAWMREVRLVLRRSVLYC